MKFTQKNLKELIKEELEKLLSETVYQTPMSEPGKTEADEGEQAAGAGIEALGALGEEGGCGDHPEEEITERPGDIVTALEDAMRALGDALKYMRGEEEEAIGDVVADLGDEAAVVNVGPMEEGVMMYPSESALGAIIKAAALPVPIFPPLPPPEVDRESAEGKKEWSAWEEKMNSQERTKNTVETSSGEQLEKLRQIKSGENPRELELLKQQIRRKNLGLKDFEIENIEREEGGFDNQERPIATVKITLSTGEVVEFPYEYRGSATRSRSGARKAGSKRRR